MPIKTNQEDNSTPPGFAVIVHHRPHQLVGTLACQSVKAKLCRLQLLAHAYQQPASDIKVHHHQQITSTKPAQSDAAHESAVKIITHKYRKEEKDAYM